MGVGDRRVTRTWVYIDGRKKGENSVVELPDHVERMSDYRLIKTIIIQIRSLANERKNMEG